ncbi:MAG: PfkB family carbohydrate kinase, partial [Planctomycetota bacterium]|nr:PfkB family carbohydrate kinase [Planctomycetota bacterium]
MRELTVFGSVNVDLVVRSEALPGPGETVVGGTFAVHCGGKGANQAVAAARAGAQVRFIGAVGDDEHGQLSRAALEAEGVDVRGLVTVDRPTGVALIAVDAAGQNQISVASGANDLARCSGEHDLFLTQLETPWPAPRARTVILNPAPARVWEGGTVDVLVPNEVEAMQLTGAQELAVAAARLAARAGQVLITAGGAGVLADGHLHPAFRVDPIDTTGAGDAFLGAYAAALAQGRGDAL